MCAELAKSRGRGGGRKVVKEEKVWELMGS